jgi:hypothetical protein
VVNVIARSVRPLPEVAAAFGPDIVVSQHGADSHAWDPLAHLRVTTTAMGEAARLVDAVAHRWVGGRWLATGGGGYDAYRVVPRTWSLVWLAGAHREVPAATPVGWRDAWAPEAARYGQVPLPEAFTDAPNAGQPVDGDQQEAEIVARRTTALVRRLVVPRLVRGATDRGWWDPLGSARRLGSAGRASGTYLVTDKIGNGSHRTKKVLIKGYFTALFASAFGEMDEQEVSRNYLLSPSDNPDKIKKGIELQARKMTDPKFNDWYETEPSRVGLKKRVQSIKEANIKKVLFKAEDMENLKDWFFKNIDNLAPKSQRDFPRLYALAEAWALLNFQHRERTPDSTCIYANSTDIENAKKVYEPILKCNGLGLTPEEYAVWKVIEKTFDESQTYTATGLRIQEIHNIYSYEKQRRCSDKRLRGMLKNFCSAGLLKEEKEGVIIKYYPIMHRETKQSGLTLSTPPLEKVESNPLFQRQ